MVPTPPRMLGLHVLQLRTGVCKPWPEATDLHLCYQIKFDRNTAMSIIQPESLNIYYLPMAYPWHM